MQEVDLWKNKKFKDFMKFNCQENFKINTKHSHF